MLIALRSFGGIAPRLDPRQLPEYGAQVATNADVDNSTLQGRRSTSFVVTPSKPGTKRTIYRFGQTINDETIYWFHWTDDVDVVKGQIAGDTEERTYFTGDSTFGHPRWTKSSIAVVGAGTAYPLASYRLGIPAPASAPGGSVSGTGSGTAQNRAYVYAYVGVDGEVGQPSLPFEITAQDGQTVTLTGILTPPAGYNINRVRIYRTVTGFNSGTDYQFVAEIASGISTYADNVLTIDLGETITSLDYEVPPSTMRGLVNMPNGMVAAFDGNDVLFCEPYRPYAWPSKYRQAVEFPVVGLGVYGETLVVLTRGNPYVMIGTNPNSISVRKAESAEACVSKRSIVNMGSAVAWASPNGLCLAGPSGIGLATENLIDKEYWTSLNPQSIHGYFYDGAYIGFFNNGSPGCFVFDPRNQLQPFTLFSTPIEVTAGYNDLVRDSLYLQVGPDIRKWDSNVPSTYVWRSRIFDTGTSVNFGWGKVKAEAYPVTMRVYAKGVLRHTQAVASENPFRLPKGFTEDEWEIELEGDKKITAAFLAQSSDELKAV